MSDRDSSPTTRFTDRAEAYARARPGYPALAMSWLCEGLSRTGTAVDIGAGTGLSTVQLADALGESWRVVALEPNRAMRDAGPIDPRIDWADGAGESTGLGDGSCDLVICAQAFHWLDQDAALDEFRRILPASGERLGLIWNTHNTELPEMAEYREIMMAHATEPPSSPSCSGWRDADVSALECHDEFGSIDVRIFENLQELTLDGLLDRAVSSSYMPNRSPGVDRLREDLARYFDRHARNGRVCLTYDCTVYRAEAIPR